MKKICLTALAATAMMFSVNSVNAQVYEETPTHSEAQEQKKDMEKIEVAELPEKVQQAVDRDFQGATVSEAYVKVKEDGKKKYKVVLTTTEGEAKELYADEEGNWLEQEKKDRIGSVIEK